MGGAPLLWPPSFAARSPRSEARHSCDLPRRGAHSYLRMGGGGGVEGPFNMVREQPSEPRRHSCGVPRREYALTPRGGAGRDRPTWSTSNSAGRGATHVAHLGANTLSSNSAGRGATHAAYLGASTLVPCLRDINNKVAPPLSRLRHKGGPSSEVAFHLCGLLRRGKLRPRRHHDRLLTPRCSNPLKAYERPTLEAALRLCGHLSRGIHTPLDALQLIHGRGEPLKARQRPPTFEAAGHICGRLRSRCLAPLAADEASPSRRSAP